MTAPRVLFIGGKGIISTAAGRVAVERGMNLTLLNRGKDTTRAVADGVRQIVGDATDPASMRAAVGSDEYDVVVNFHSFTPDQARADVELFTGRTGHYVYISSASAYQKPVERLPITESTPLRNPYWQYSRDKIASEDVLTAAYRESAFPVTVVRPSHTYDETALPLVGDWTAVDRIRRGKPVIVPGDGTSLWTLTHTRDFARAFVGLLGNSRAIGDAIHITSDESLTWNQITQLIGRAAGREPVLAHIASEAIGRALPDIGPGLVGDKANSVIFDNSKIKSLVPGWQATIPYREGVLEVIDWFDADESRREIDPELDAAFGRLIAAHC
jgi:nucleoside-diphosphate-sugar epimerase